MNETQLVSNILHYLNTRNIWAWRNNVGGFWRKGFYVHCGLKGLPDIIGIMPDGSGRFFGIEVKGDTGKLSGEQTGALSKIRRLGGVGIVARSLEDVMESEICKK